MEARTILFRLLHLAKLKRGRDLLFSERYRYGCLVLRVWRDRFLVVRWGF